MPDNKPRGKRNQDSSEDEDSSSDRKLSAAKRGRGNSSDQKLENATAGSRLAAGKLMLHNNRFNLLWNVFDKSGLHILTILELI